MLNRFSPARRQFFWVIYFLFMLLLVCYSVLAENYFPEGTECSLFKQIFNKQCVFAIRQSGDRRAFFTADGNSIVYIDGNVLKIEPIGTIKSWYTGDELLHPYQIYSFAVSPDRNKAIACIMNDNGTIFEFWIWNIENKSLLKKLSQNSCPRQIEFSVDGAVLGYDVGRETNVNLLNWQTGELQSMPGEKITFSPTGNMIAIEGQQTIKLLAYPSLELVNTLENVDYVHDFAFSPDGSLLASNTLDEVYLWDTKNGAQIDKLEQLVDSRCNLRFSTSTKIVSCADIVDESFVLTWFLFSMREAKQSAAYYPIIKVGSHQAHFVDVSIDESKILVVFSDHVGVFNSPETFR